MAHPKKQLRTPPILALPAELRNQIYQEVFVDRWNVLVRTIERADWLQRKWSPPALLHTCSEIRNEASAVYYGGNTFHFCDEAAVVKEFGYGSTLKLWLKSLGREQRRLLRRIDIAITFDAIVARRELAALHSSMKRSDIAFAEDVLYTYCGKNVSEGWKYAFLGLRWRNLPEIEEFIRGGQVPRYDD